MPDTTLQTGDDPDRLTPNLPANTFDVVMGFVASELPRLDVDSLTAKHRERIEDVIVSLTAVLVDSAKPEGSREGLDGEAAPTVAQVSGEIGRLTRHVEAVPINDAVEAAEITARLRKFVDTTLTRLEEFGEVAGWS